jgi:hypothetical protein
VHSVLVVQLLQPCSNILQHHQPLQHVNRAGQHRTSANNINGRHSPGFYAQRLGCAAPAAR